MIRRPRRSTLCPYTTLFRSCRVQLGCGLTRSSPRPFSATGMPTPHRRLRSPFTCARALFRAPLRGNRDAAHFFNDPATTEIYALSLHDALPILPGSARLRLDAQFPAPLLGHRDADPPPSPPFPLHLCARAVPRSPPREPGRRPFFQ